VGDEVSDGSPEGDLDFAYLTTTGRITGSPHEVEIWFALEGETAYILAGDRDRADWVRNLMVSRDVVLRIGDRKRTTTARVLEADTDEDTLARRLLLEKYVPRDNTDLTDWGRTALPVAVAWPA
jgi:deazaflavin-dependent oxidoreductase (nitroreductase family)